MLAQTILAWMFTLTPSAPWQETYGETANAISEAAAENPVWGTPERTAAVLVALAKFESNFRPDAMGDCHGQTPTLGHCQSLGLFQVSKANAPAKSLLDVSEAPRRALVLMGQSRRVCRGRPLQEQLGWYASGGGTCGGLVESRHRMGLAIRLVPQPST